MVNGTFESEFRTRFWPMRFTYSVTTESWTSFTPCSTCCEYCCPMATCFSSEYQLPAPVLQPTLRFPIASRFFSVDGFGAFLSGFAGGASLEVVEAAGALLPDEDALGGCEGLVESWVGYPCAQAVAEATMRASTSTPNLLIRDCMITPFRATFTPAPTEHRLRNRYS